MSTLYRKYLRVIERLILPISRSNARLKARLLGINVAPRAVFYGRNRLTVAPGGTFEIGADAKIGENVMIRVSSNGHVIIKERVEIQDSCCFLCSGNLTIGAGSILVNGTIIYCDGSVTLGENVVIAAYTHIFDVDHETSDLGTPILSQGLTKPRPVAIGDDVWLGAKCTVAPGVHIGSHSIVGAHSFINKDIPEYSVAVGSPAKVLRRRNQNNDEEPKK